MCVRSSTRGMSREEISVSRFSFSHLHNWNRLSLIRNNCLRVSSSIIMFEPPALSICATCDGQNTDWGRCQQHTGHYPSFQNAASAALTSAPAILQKRRTQKSGGVLNVFKQNHSD